MTKFLLIRHAMTDTAGKRLSGTSPGVHLNAIGVQQANMLARRISGKTISAIYSSPLERAVETAAPVAGLLEIKTITCEDFIEIDYGEWTNCAIDEVRDEPQFQRYNSFRSCSRIPGGELMVEGQLRMIKGMEKLLRAHPGQTVIIISHSDLIRAAVAYYAGIHLDMFHRIEISPASISIIEIYDETARILTVNDTGEIMDLLA